MPLRLTTLTDRSDHPLFVESVIVLAALVGVAFWQLVVRVSLSGVAETLHRSEGVVAGGVLTGGVLVTGLVAYAGVYANYRHLDIGVERPDSDDLPVAFVAVVTPAALVGLTKGVGLFTGVSYGSLTKTGYGAAATLPDVLPLAGLELLVGVPVLVVVAQVLVQESFERVSSGWTVVALTTVTASFVLLHANRGITVVPEWGRLVGAAVFLVLLEGALYVSARVERRWTQRLSYAPVLGFALLVVGSELATVGSVAGGLFVLTHVLVLGVAAAGYDRTDSVFVPALAYLSLLASNRAVVFFLEAGTTGL